MSCRPSNRRVAMSYSPVESLEILCDRTAYLKVTFSLLLPSLLLKRLSV